MRADTIAGVLLASPGASTAVSAMLGLLEQCFPDRIGAWRPALQEAIPSYGHRLSEEPALLDRVRADTMQVLELTGSRSTRPGSDGDDDLAAGPARRMWVTAAGSLAQRERAIDDGCDRPASTSPVRATRSAAFSELMNVPSFWPTNGDSTMASS